MTMLVLSDNEDLERAVRNAVGDLVRINTVPLEVGAKADLAGLAVVLIDGRRHVDQAVQVAQDFDDLRPDITTLLHAELSADVFSRAMQAGVRDLLTPADNDDRIREAVKRALEVSDRRRSLRVDAAETKNKLIMVMSPKGGAGKTTIASNLAIGLAYRAPKQVVLVDADLQFGDVGNALRLLAETNVRDAIAGGLQDVTEIKVHLTPHRSGLYALCAPDVPGVADEITAQAFTKAVTMLSEEFRFVVVDTDPGLGERTLSVMDYATDLVFVAATDVASVRGLHKTIEALDRIGMSTQTRHFVLNRANAKVGLDVDDIAATLGMQPDVLVPSHVSLPVSMNQGVPILEDSDSSPAVPSMWQLVDRFLLDPDKAQDDEDASRKHGGGRLRRRG